VEQRKHMFVKFDALVITRSRLIHICTISLNVLRYTFRQIINAHVAVFLEHVNSLLLSIQSKKYVFISNMLHLRRNILLYRFHILNTIIKVTPPPVSR
jgi:hypothetical protein